MTDNDTVADKLQSPGNSKALLYCFADQVTLLKSKVNEMKDNMENL